MHQLNAALRLRRSARIILVDADMRTLMFRYDVPGRPPFWVTAGGECEAGERFEDAARRELLEETGIGAEPGPQIARLTPEYVTVEGEPVQGDERFYLVRVEKPVIDTALHTEQERRLMTQHRWFTLNELADWHEALFPDNLADLVREEIAA
ncbi:NUDIX hydrolase [Qipengyuania oceanensis]|uniref:NUDIX domain-containing protein n=1 Tax=Qipengyuania oceanensis TaxID=1463597 RepID=A0A844YJR0_9SPHN|nr:NUDIX domain-containing protein [Qipengyuania oceanensis]MXO63559.1 NUDIX domain-containing protein [Qipengyuania oceanensis]